MKIGALAGFLGLTSDWDCFHREDFIPFDWQSIPLESLIHWAAEFNSFVRTKENHPKILMGYSLGGRLALHALIDSPEQWQGAVIISAHPGLQNLSDRHLRCCQDLVWADRFEKEEWESLMQSWNEQQVFAGDSFIFERQESDYQRDQLVNALVHGSLGLQGDLREKIARLPMPILWLTGSLDRKFSDAAQDLSFAHSASCCKQIEGAGHRFPWSHKQQFLGVINAFIEMC